MSKALRLGIAGLGTVGGGVLDILGRHGNLVAARAGRAAERKKRAGSMGSSDTHTELSKCRIRESE